MPQYFADHALLPDGLHANVTLDVEAAGYFRAVTPDTTRGNAVHLAGCVLPGLANLHGHAFQRAMAGLAERRLGADDSFWSWRETMYRLVQRVTPEQLTAIAAQVHAEMLQAGYTHTVEFHYLHNQPDGRPYDDPLEMANRILAAQAASGIGLTLLPTLYRYGGFNAAPANDGQRRFLTDPDSYMKRLAALNARTQAKGRVATGMALHSLRAVARDDLRSLPTAAHDLSPDMPVHIHVAEQTREVEACRAAHGTTPVALLLDNAPVDGRWCAIHATHMTPEETRNLAASGAVAGLCPTTEANLGDGLFDLSGYWAHNGRFGLGSDSHVALDPREELRLLEYEARLAQRARNVFASDATPSTGETLYRAALDGGARASGAAIGRLAPGARADLVVLDPTHPSLAAAKPDNLLNAWIFTNAGSAVRDVAVAGEWLVTDGHHRDAEAIAATYRQAVQALMD